MDEGSKHFRTFTAPGNAPRGILVSKPIHGIFSDPDGDALTYTVIRVQIEADRAAVQDPLGEAGPLSAFFSDVPMLDGTGSASAPLLLPMLAEAGATIEGLRLRNGVLILKVERDGRAIQIRVTHDGPLLAGGGVRVWHDWGLRLPMNIAQLTDLWSVSGGPAPRGVVGGRERGGTATTR